MIILTSNFIIGKRLKKRLNRFIVMLLLPAICWLFVNAAINQHSHILISGEVITHAHPYSADKNPASPYQSHNHSNTSYFFLSTISNPATVFAAIIAILSIELFKAAIIRFGIIEKSIQKTFFYVNNSRGPPMNICF